MFVLCLLMSSFCHSNDDFFMLIDSFKEISSEKKELIERCDVVLTEKMYTNCYSLSRSSTVYGIVKIDTTQANKNNIKKRPVFKLDKRVPKPNNLSVYSKFDKGHTLVSDASFDYSKDVLESTYLMSNITPQHSRTNRYSYARVEAYERLLSKSVSELYVFVRVDFKDSGYIPSGYYRRYFNSAGLSECFYTINDNTIRTLEEQMIKCSE